MLEFSIRFDDTADLQAFLWNLARLEIDMAPLGRELSRIFQDENRRARLAGVDRDEGPLVDIAEVTRRTRRSASGHADPSAYPLVPGGEESRVVANHRVVTDVRPNGLTITAGWVGIPWLRHHIEGAGRLPVRDIAGATPEAIQFVEDVLVEHVRLRVEEAMDPGRARA